MGRGWHGGQRGWSGGSQPAQGYLPSTPGLPAPKPWAKLLKLKESLKSDLKENIQHYIFFKEQQDTSGTKNMENI